MRPPVVLTGDFESAPFNDRHQRLGNACTSVRCCLYVASAVALKCFSLFQLRTHEATFFFRITVD